MAKQNTKTSVKTSQQLRIGEIYTRAALRDRFGIHDATLNTGVFRPEGHDSIWLFVTENKPADRTPYSDRLNGDLLEWDGQSSGRTDDLIMNHRRQSMELLLFYRKRKYEHSHAGFCYEGSFEYVAHKGTRPAHFTLRRTTLSAETNLSLQTASVQSAFSALENCGGIRRRQGFLRNPEFREAIERLAMNEASKYLRSRGYEVEDVSESKPYDLLAKNASELVHVEVKGTTTAGEEIILTRNEVDHVLSCRQQTVLFILYGIEVKETSTGVIAEGGTIRVVWPWIIDKGQCTVLSYFYRVPPGA